MEHRTTAQCINLSEDFLGNNPGSYTGGTRHKNQDDQNEKESFQRHLAKNTILHDVSEISYHNTVKVTQFDITNVQLVLMET